MIRRILLGAALVGASLSRLNCQLVFPAKPAIRGPFLGCFKGAVTEPAGPGQITIVLEAPPEDNSGGGMIGCISSTEPIFDANMAGEVLEDRTQARFAVVPTGGRPAFVLLVTRQPAEGNATGLTLVNESDRPFKRAQDLPRCATAATCQDLGLAQNFIPGGAP